VKALQEVAHYREVHPDILVHALKFFSFENANVDQSGTHRPRSMNEFLTHYHKNHSEPVGLHYPQPGPVNQMLSVLAKAGMIMDAGLELRLPNLNGMANCYYSSYTKNGNNLPDDMVRRHLNSTVFGFPYIYDELRESVIPIVVTKLDKEIGTVIINSPASLLTARHCIDQCAKLSISGISADELRRYYWNIKK
jgi:hypothetical protein